MTNAPFDPARRRLLLLWHVLKGSLEPTTLSGCQPLTQVQGEYSTSHRNLPLLKVALQAVRRGRVKATTLVHDRLARTTATAADTIVAIDLGRFKSVACVDDRATRTATFHTLATGRADFVRLVARHCDALVVIEACGNDWDALPLEVSLPGRARRRRRDPVELFGATRPGGSPNH